MPPRRRKETVDPMRGADAPARYFGPNLHLNQCVGECKPCGYRTGKMTIEAAKEIIREHQQEKGCI